MADYDIDLFAWSRDLGQRLSEAKAFVEDKEKKAEAEKFAAELARLEENHAVQTQEELAKIAEQLKNDEIEPEMAEKAIAGILARPIAEAMDVVSRAITSHPDNQYIQNVAQSHMALQLQKRELLFQQYAATAQGEIEVEARKREEQKLDLERMNAEANRTLALSQAANTIEPIVTTAVQEGLLSEQEGETIMEEFGLPKELVVNQPPGVLSEEGQQKYMALSQTIYSLQRQVAQNPDDPELQQALHDAIKARDNLERRAALEVTTSHGVRNLLQEVKTGGITLSDAFKWWVMNAYNPLALGAVVSNPEEFKKQIRAAKTSLSSMWERFKQTDIGRDIATRLESIFGGSGEASPAAQQGQGPPTANFRSLYGESQETRVYERGARPAGGAGPMTPALTPMSEVPEPEPARMGRAQAPLTDVSEVEEAEEEGAAAPQRRSRAARTARTRARPKPSKRAAPAPAPEEAAGPRTTGARPDLTDIPRHAAEARQRLIKALYGEE